MGTRLERSHLKRITFITLCSFFVLNEATDWLILRLWSFRGPVQFLDLNTVLTNVDCFEEFSWNVYNTEVGNPCVNYIYGSTLIRILYFLGLGSEQTVLIGYISTIILCLILSNLSLNFFQASKLRSFVFVIAVVSPPTLLLVERANFDWLIFSLVYLGCFLFATHRRRFGLIVVALSALIKFYSFPLLLFALFLTKSRKEVIFGCVVAVLSLVIILRDLTLLNTIYVAGWNATFGNNIWASYLTMLDIKLSTFASSILGFSITAILVIILHFIIPNSQIHEYKFRSSSTTEYFASFSMIIFLACFFAGINFDYRLVFLIPALWLVSENVGLGLFKFYSFLHVVTFVFSYPVLKFQPIGDLSINLIVALMILIIFRNRKYLFTTSL